MASAPWDTGDASCPKKGIRLNTEKNSSQKTARTLTVIILILAIVCGAAILFLYRAGASAGLGMTAEIYQDGVLIRSIPLHEVSQTYTFTVTADNGASNEIEVRPDSIGILSASCPDKLCVQQGFIHSSLLPVTCLPNHLVIQLKKTDTAQDQAPDMISH